MIKQVSIRKIESAEDIDFLFQMMTSTDQFLFSSATPINSKREFEEWFTIHIRNDFSEFRMIMYSNELAGYVYNYDHAEIDGHCKICANVRACFRNSGAGSFGSLLFMDYLFRNYPYRKLYTTVYDYNMQSLTSNTQSGLVYEGAVKGYRYYRGRYYDMRYFSISREQFYSKFSELIEGD